MPGILSAYQQTQQPKQQAGGTSATPQTTLPKQPKVTDTTTQQPEAPAAGILKAFQGPALNPDSARAQTPFAPKITKTSTPDGQLPEGAIGWAPDGTPYFGDGIQGILKRWKYDFTKDVPAPNSQKWDDLKNQWDTLLQRQNAQHGNLEEGKIALQTVGLAADAVKTAWQTGEADKSIISPILKATGASVQAIGDLFSIPAKAVEQTIGAKEGLQEAANTLGGPLPRLDQNNWTKALEEIPVLGAAYDWANIALSPSDNKWEYTKQKIDEGWNSGRILYSQIFDKTLKDKFLQEYRQGGDPGLIALKIQNPLAEMGGQLLLDPTWLVGAFAKAGKTAKELQAAKEASLVPELTKLTEGADALKAIDNAKDDVEAAKAFSSLADAQLKAVAKVQGESRLLNVTYTTESLTTKSRQDSLIGKSKDFLGNMALVLKEQGLSYDAIAEGIVYGAKSVSKDKATVQEGLAGLRGLPNAHMWLTSDAIESFSLVHNLLKDENGVLNGAKLAALQKVTDPAEFAEKAVALLKASAVSMFPDVSELRKASGIVAEAEKLGKVDTLQQRTRDLAKAYENLPAHVKIANDINEQLGKIRNPINKTLSWFYFNAQGGVAVKNIVTNDELILIDKGAGAWVKDGNYWSLAEVDNYLKDIFGGVLPSSAHGFTSLVDAAKESKSAIGLQDIQGAQGIAEKLGVIGKGLKEQGAGLVMNVGEESAAKRIVGAAVRDVMETMLPKAMPSLAKEVEAGAISQEQANKLTSLLLKNNGNVERALNEFRDMYKVGNIEKYRNMDFVSKYERDGLQGLGYWGEIEQRISQGFTSLAEKDDFFAKLKASIDSRAELAVKDIAGLASDHPSAETWGDMMKAVQEGLLDPGQHEVFTAFMEAAEQGRLAYQKALDDVAVKAMQALSEQGKITDATALGQKMNEYRATIAEAAPAIAKQTREITSSAWKYTEEAKAVSTKNITRDFLEGLWTRAGLNGDPPLDLTKGSFLKELWKQRFEKVSAAWTGNLEAVVGSSEDLLTQMSKVVDTSEIEGLAADARKMTAQAQELRTAAFENKSLRIRPKENLYTLAEKYGVPTIGKSRRPNEAGLLAIVNKYSNLPEERKIIATWKKSGDVYKTTVGGIKYEIATDGTLSKIENGARQVLDEFKNVEDAKAAFSSGNAGKKFTETVNLTNEGFSGFSGGNPLQIIADHGGVNKAEFSDVMSGILGHDKQGVMPGVFTTKGMGIDDAGRLLSEYGFMSAEDAKDANKIRDYLRNYKDFMPGEKTITQEIRDLGAPYYDAEDKLRNVPKDWQYQDINEVPNDVLKKALDNQRKVHGLPPLPEEAGIAVPPPHPMGAQPTIPRAWNESARGAKAAIDHISQNITQLWGQTDNSLKYTPEMESVLRKVSDVVTPKVGEIKSIAMRVADEQRKFTLLNYGERTYGDVAKAYVLPYHFFYTQSYKNWIRRLATNPELISRYGIYKNGLEQINKDLPDWYKQQLDVTGLLGIKTDHPLFFNLESTFNPLYGLTGTDFNDPAKRVNWATATMDDLGKFGPTIWAPIQMGIAAKLYMDGQTDAASRWGNRVIPETAQIKAVTSLFGHPLELDPAVNFFSGGIDPYERGRMGYAAAQLISSGQYSPEEIQQEFQQQSGSAWDKAYQLAVQSRAYSSISSYFLGVGFKPRSTNDVMVEDMYTKLNKLYAMSDTMSPDEYKNQWEQLRASYPNGLVDTVLLAKKGGAKRDAAYAYSVLGRLPPGEMSGVFKAIGISSQDVSKFYSSKGFTDPKVSFTSTEQQRFMTAIIDLGAMLKIPDSATRGEWNTAREAYSNVTDEISNHLGKDIWDKVSLYYDLKDDNREMADSFKQAHPEITTALQMKGDAIAHSPVLSAYYGGIDNIEAYLSGKTRQTLSDKYGADIYNLQQEYFNSTNQRSFLAQHPELRRFWDDKRKLDAQSEKDFIQFGLKLPQGKGAQFRSDFTPQSGVQQTLYTQLQQKNQIPDWQTVSQGMPDWLQQEVADNTFNQRPVSKRAQQELTFLASSGGYYDYKDLLRQAGLALQYSMQFQQ